jgi:hypothetical protein
MFQLERYAQWLAQDSPVKVFQLEHFTHAVIKSGKLKVFQLEHSTHIALCAKCSNWNTCGNRGADVA